MATIYKRGNIYWISYKNRIGLRVQESTGLTDKKAAESLKKHIEVQEKASKLEKFGFNPIRLTQWQEEYEQHRKGRVSKKTLERDRQTLNNFINFCGDPELSDITKKDIENWYSNLINSHLSNATANLMLRHIKTFFNTAVEFEYLTVTPCKIKPIRENEKIIRILSKSEVSKLLAVMPGNWQMLTKVALYTGARAGEICRMKTSDVNLNSLSIIIKSTDTSPTKSRKSRVIPIPKATREFFQFLIDNSNDGYLVHNSKGKPLNVDRIVKNFRRYVSVSGIKKCTFHDLRRTYGGWLVMSGADLVTVQQNLGHSSINVTIKHYAHVMMSHKSEQVNKLPEF